MEISLQEQAYQKGITEYVSVGGLSVSTAANVMIWDILTHLRADYQLLLRHRTKLPTWVYLLSRWSTLLYGLVGVVFLTTPVKNCVALIRVACVVYHITLSSTALLFFLRVRAIFHRSLRITVIFFILWLTVVGGSLSAVVSVSGAHFGGTSSCVFSNVRSYNTASGNSAVVLFDTCVFVAITWRLSTTHRMGKRDTFQGWKANLFGTYLPAFSKALLQDGQKYYMVAMVANLLVLVIEFVPGVPVPYRQMFLAPAVQVTNIMACRVFRHTKKRGNEDVIHEASTIKFGRRNNLSVYVHTQVGHLTTISAAENGDHGSNVTEIEEGSKSSRVSKDFIAVV
ncbi:hypothetical protein BDZ94DRAFT_1300141 [Collybia nuda]|uniref:Uncharacterized protein n=1 Tax=Collybia nuda TaxID=64659 RepID=A0A9P6CBZ0_9AGAR|nr:hypothetical protein BDZ94DRAFT_1300141 [Collybia nuda]